MAVLLLGKWAVRCDEDAGGKSTAPGPRAFGNLGDKLDQGQEMPTPRLYHGKKETVQEKHYGVASRAASLLRHESKTPRRETVLTQGQASSRNQESP